MDVVIFALAGAASRLPAGLPPGALHTAEDAAGLARLLAEADYRAAVLVSDGLAESLEAGVAAAVRASGRPVIEVRSARWDGATPSPVSAACRGVVSGFGPAGATAALRLLQAELAAK